MPRAGRPRFRESPALIRSLRTDFCRASSRSGPEAEKFFTGRRMRPPTDRTHDRVARWRHLHPSSGRGAMLEASQKLLRHSGFSHHSIMTTMAHRTALGVRCIGAKDRNSARSRHRVAPTLSTIR